MVACHRRPLSNWVDRQELDAGCSRQGSRSAGLGLVLQMLHSNPAAGRRATEMVIIYCDIGEAFGLYKVGDDEGLIPNIDVAHAACGLHVTSFNHLRKTLRL